LTSNLPPTISCLISRGGRTTRATGALFRCGSLDEIPCGPNGAIALVPFCMIRERGFEAHSADEQILVLVVEDETEVVSAAVTANDCDESIEYSTPVYEPDDEGYVRLVQRVISEEIQQGEGSNFLISREARTKLEGPVPVLAEQMFWRLVRMEPNAYMTFCFSDGDTYWIGASPERNVTIRDRTITMNPICGTLPKRPDLTPEELLAFVTDPKEIHELFQVVDETLKMMARLSPTGGRVLGPYLKEMASVIHTEYVLQGEADLTPIEAFRQSMFAPTMVGSPLQNAARVIARHESSSRGYYSSAILLLDKDEQSLDSAITIRTMELRADGTGIVRAGASLVRDSNPNDEVREVAAKASAMFGALGPSSRPSAVLDAAATPQVLEALASRNTTLSEFWMAPQGTVADAPTGLRAILIDHEDDFSAMLGHLLHHAGIDTEVLPFDADVASGDADLFVLGPGPGDPLATSDRKIRRLHERVATLLAAEVPFIAVCLSHQVLCHTLGLEIESLDPPLQGVQRLVDLYGEQEHVGFYNTFIPVAPQTQPQGVEMALSGQHVVSLRSARFISYQFHVESVLTSRGMQILQAGVAHLTQPLVAPKAAG
jgi:2-amino-4-deoxychorismate synthase